VPVEDDLALAGLLHLLHHEGDDVLEVPTV